MALALVAAFVAATLIWGHLVLPAAPLLPCMLTLLALKMKARR
ncbi:hypothetical protein [Cellulosimicrobium sp. Marseille-Q4280]|nr:hypothetical protein [Cellulosimicrobium sp. Marseille-Q4280]